MLGRAEKHIITPRLAYIIIRRRGAGCRAGCGAGGGARSIVAQAQLQTEHGRSGNKQTFPARKAQEKPEKGTQNWD